MIAHADKVESYFGYWPVFADGKITTFSFEAPASIRIGINYIDADRGMGANVLLLFSGVSNVELSELRSENVIDELLISEEHPINTSIEACYGLSGRFSCEAVEVLSLMPNNSLNPTGPDGPSA